MLKMIVKTYPISILLIVFFSFPNFASSQNFNRSATDGSELTDKTFSTKIQAEVQDSENIVLDAYLVESYRSDKAGEHNLARRNRIFWDSRTRHNDSESLRFIAVSTECSADSEYSDCDYGKFRTEKSIYGRLQGNRPHTVKASFKLGENLLAPVESKYSIIQMKQQGVKRPYWMIERQPWSKNQKAWKGCDKARDRLGLAIQCELNKPSNDSPFLVLSLHQIDTKPRQICVVAMESEVADWFTLEIRFKTGNDPFLVVNFNGMERCRIENKWYEYAVRSKGNNIKYGPYFGSGDQNRAVQNLLQIPVIYEMWVAEMEIDGTMLF